LYQEKELKTPIHHHCPCPCPLGDLSISRAGKIFEPIIRTETTEKGDNKKEK
jgi:hypothetical protein